MNDQFQNVGRKTKQNSKNKNKKIDDLENFSEENEENSDGENTQKTSSRNKKKSLRMQLEEQEKITFNEKKQQEKLQKFEELKNFYLKDLIAQKDSEIADSENEEIIIRVFHNNHFSGKFVLTNTKFK